MIENDITITLTESQHELLIDVLTHAQDAINLSLPFDGLCELPLNNSIVQRYTTLDNLKELFKELFSKNTKKEDAQIEKTSKKSSLPDYIEFKQ